MSISRGPFASETERIQRSAQRHRPPRQSKKDWWAAASLLLDDITAEMLTGVVRKHQKKISKGTVGPGKVIGDTTLGVWVHLLGRGGHSALGRAIDYETNLWRPALRFGFATGTFTASGRERRPTRADVYHRAALFQRLRNRAAHHEPILDGVKSPGSETTVSLEDVRKQTVELLGWMSPALAELHRTETTLSKLIAQRPTK